MFAISIRPADTYPYPPSLASAARIRSRSDIQRPRSFSTPIRFRRHTDTSKSLQSMYLQVVTHGR
jgi:hypothetical protein